MFLERFYPDNEAGSIDSIDFQGLYRSGMRAVIFDIDNTLVPHGAPADPHAIAFFQDLRAMGFKTMLLSNNKEPRVKSFAQEVGSPYLFRAGKPKAGGYRRAMEEMGSSPADTVFVGDQLFTDIWGAKKAGIVTYLVRPIHPREEIQIVLKRRLEAIVLFFYHRSRK